MASKLLAPLVHFIIFLIERLGYGGIATAMAIESASIPLPSEVIMPFAGFLVSRGELNFIGVVTAGTLGCLIGSWFSWWIGKRYGEKFVRQLIRRYGKFVFIFEYELDESIKVFRRHGEVVIFFSRLLPVIRTFISLPAGIAQMSFRKFAFYTVIGSFIWSLALAAVGVRLGANWSQLGPWFHRFDSLIGILLLIILVLYPWHKIRHQRRYQNNKKLTNS